MILPEESLGHIGGNGSESQETLLVNRRGQNINSHVALKNGYAVIRHNATKILRTTMEDFLEEEITEIFLRDPGEPKTDLDNSGEKPHINVVDVWSSIAHYAPWQDIKLSTNNTPLVNYDITVDEECFDNYTCLQKKLKGYISKPINKEMATYFVFSEASFCL
jgi:hypothetical protein